MVHKFVGDACEKRRDISQGEITAPSDNSCARFGHLLQGFYIIVGIFLYTQDRPLHFLGEPPLRFPPFARFHASLLNSTLYERLLLWKKMAGFLRPVSWWEQLACLAGSVWLIYQYTLEKGMELTAFHARLRSRWPIFFPVYHQSDCHVFEKRFPGHTYYTLSGQWKTMETVRLLKLRQLKLTQNLLFHISKQM